MTLAAILQLASGPDVQQNINAAIEGIRKAAEAGAQLVALPEEFATLGLSLQQKLSLAEEYQKGTLQSQLADAAKENHIWVVAGTLPIKADNNKISSSCLVFDANGTIQARYDKIHLFDVQVGAQESYQESKGVAAGNEVVVVNTPIGCIGLSICYDIRFPELFRALMRKGAEVMLLPSAFTIPTGKAHWEVLLRARAIENLCYMLAPAEMGIRESGKGTYGHSMIIGPWGDIMQQATTEPGLLIAEIDLKKLHQIRQEFPALTHGKMIGSFPPPTNELPEA